MVFARIATVVSLACLISACSFRGTVNAQTATPTPTAIATVAPTPAPSVIPTVAPTPAPSVTPTAAATPTPLPIVPAHILRVIEYKGFHDSNNLDITQPVALTKSFSPKLFLCTDTNYATSQIAITVTPAPPLGIMRGGVEVGAPQCGTAGSWGMFFRMDPGTVYAVTAGLNTVQVSTPATVPVITPVGHAKPGFFGFLLHPDYYRPQTMKTCTTSATGVISCVNTPDPVQTQYRQDALALLGKLPGAYARTDDQTSAVWSPAISVSGPLDFAHTTAMSVKPGATPNWYYGSHWLTRDWFATAGIEVRPNFIQYGIPHIVDPFSAHDTFYNPSDYANFASVGTQLEIAFAKYRNHAPITHEILGNEWGQGFWCKQQHADPAAPTVAIVTDCRDGVSGNAAELFHQAYVAIKAQDPNIVVIGPEACDGGSRCYNIYAYFHNLYVAGCQTKFPCWDRTSVHHYGWPAFQNGDPGVATNPNDVGRWDAYKRVQAVAVADHACALLPGSCAVGTDGVLKPIVVFDEDGWSASQSPTGLDRRVRLMYVTEYFNKLLADPTVESFTTASGCIGDNGPPDGDFTTVAPLTKASDGSCVPNELYALYQTYLK